MEEKKVILAYSGGLDTSIILKWLIEEGYEVICYMADVGQNEDFEKAKKKALSIGASKVYIEDLKEEFIEKYVFEALKANAVYENKYLLGTALARPIIAKKQVEIALAEGTNIVAHGATGKGNDQIRFELIYYQFLDDVKIISPWKEKSFLDKFKGRSDLINYAKEKNIPIDSTLKKPYSMDENIVHISYEAGDLENPMYEPKEEMFKWSKSFKDAPDKETSIVIEFKKGIPVKIENKTENKTVTGALNLFKYLNELGALNAIGREDIVENRFVGMKSRGIYETPAGTILLKAHIDLESLVLDKEVLHIKSVLMPKIAQIIYNGFWFSAEFDFLMAAINKSQEKLSGKVHMKLYKGNCYIVGRESKNSLYDQNIASMDEEGGYDQEDAKGFIKLNALRLKLNKNETME